MGQFSPAELEELRLLAASAMDMQFQFWVTITFAVVVARFAAGRRLIGSLRYVAAVLYSLATFVLIARFMDEGDTAMAYGLALGELGIDSLRVGMPTIVARYTLFAFGTCTTLFYLLRPDGHEG